MKSLDQIEARTLISSLPYTINTAGSYYLTGNLTGSSGITVAANDVTIDLNGFTLTGPGNKAGVLVPAVQTNLCIRNGSLVGWTNGIRADQVVAGLYRNLNVTGCTGVGDSDPAMYVGYQSSVLDCNISNNRKGDGLTTGNQCLIARCNASANGRNGFSIGSNSAIADCVASANDQNYGITAQDGSTVYRCTASGNAIAISVHYGCTVSGCTIRGNANGGILAISGNVMTQNTCDVNNTVNASGSGGIILVGRANKVDGNSLTANGHAGVYAPPANPAVSEPSGSNLVIRNTFWGAAYVLDSANNTSGPFVNMQGGGGVISSTNPWANIGY